MSEIFRNDFEDLYGPNGKWVKLFQTGEGYLGTQLVKEVSVNNQYVTIDRWASQELYERFLEKNRKLFETIDKEGENFTTSESKIGWFED